MRQNRAKNSMEKKCEEWNTVCDGSALLLLATAGGELRRGRSSIRGSGLFGEVFLQTALEDILANSGRYKDTGAGAIKSLTVQELLEIFYEVAPAISALADRNVARSILADAHAPVQSDSRPGVGESATRSLHGEDERAISDLRNTRSPRANDAPLGASGTPQVVENSDDMMMPAPRYNQSALEQEPVSTSARSHVMSSQPLTRKIDLASRVSEESGSGVDMLLAAAGLSGDSDSCGQRSADTLSPEEPRDAVLSPPDGGRDQSLGRSAAAVVSSRTEAAPIRLQALAAGSVEGGPEHVAGAYQITSKHIVPAQRATARSYVDGTATEMTVTCNGIEVPNTLIFAKGTFEQHVQNKAVDYSTLKLLPKKLPIEAYVRRQLESRSPGSSAGEKVFTYSIRIRTKTNKIPLNEPLQFQIVTAIYQIPAGPHRSWREQETRSHNTAIIRRKRTLEAVEQGQRNGKIAKKEIDQDISAVTTTGNSLPLLEPGSPRSLVQN
jgi:hypothetical protein